MPVKSATKQKRTPRPHQEEAIRAVVKGFKTEDRGQLLMACGTGKTLTAYWIKQRLAGRTLVLLPSINLVSQTLKEWATESGEDFSWIAVCSDKTVAKRDADEWVVNASDLGIPVTSDPDVISDYLQQAPNGVVFATYQSSGLVAEAQANSEVPIFDLVLADEAHRTAGKVVDSFGIVLDDQKIRAKKRLFMTATPRVLSDRLKTRANGENIDVVCMDDKSLFGKVFYSLSFSKAISQGLLSDYRVVIIGVDDPMVQANIQRNIGITTTSSQVINAEEYANHIALSKAIEDYSLRRVITFHSRVKGASNFADNHQQILNRLPIYAQPSKTVKTGFVSGDMDSKKRNQIMNGLREIEDHEISILSNARCLSEGVDVPTLDGIAFLNPRKSQVDIIQAVGRAIRKSDDKSCGYIILPVYLGENGDLEEEIEASRFRHIWQVILALKSQDDQLCDALDQLRVSKGNGKTSDKDLSVLQDKVLFDLPASFPDQFIDSLKTMVVVNTTDTWKEHYGRLIAYKEEFGHTLVPWDYPILGDWVGNQRTEYKRGKLSQERIQLLEEIGFTFDLYEYKWDDRLRELIAFKKQYGHMVVPGEREGLRSWIVTQRVAYRQGKLSEERIAKLTAIGFSFDRSADEKWMKQYSNYIAHMNQKGYKTIDQQKASNWATLQRKRFKENKLEDWQISFLEDIDFKWNAKDAVWHERYCELLQFVQKFGHACPKRAYGNLADWVVFQRTLYRKGKLLPERVALLEKVDGWVWTTRRLRSAA